MNPDLIWPVLYLIAGLLLVGVEGLVPSGGLIGLLAFGLLSLSVWQAFQVSNMAGGIFVGTILLFAPVLFALALYLFPKTPLGRLLLLRPPTREEVEPEPTGPRLNHLIGQIGRTTTPLRPSGMVDFEGRRLDGMSEEGLIPAGTMVRAIGLRGRQVVVRPAVIDGLEPLPEGSPEPRILPSPRNLYDDTI